MSKCGNCSYNIKASTPNLKCDACQTSLHPHCVSDGRTEQELMITRSKSKSIKVVCNSCEHNMSSFRDLKSPLSDLRSEFTASIDNLKRNLQDQIDSVKSTLILQTQQQQSG